MKRALAGIAAAGVVAICAGIGPAFGHTNSLTAVRTCRASGTVKFSPPLGQTAQTTKHIYTNANTRLASCVLSTATGTFAGTLTGTGSCAKATAKGTLTFTWNSGPKSVASVTFKSLTNGKGKLTGKVTSGQLKGTAVSGTLTFTMLKGNCDSVPGVSQANFKGKLTI